MKYQAFLMAGLASSIPLYLSAANNKSNQPEPIDQGEVVTSRQIQSGYNYPATVKLNRDWNVFVTGDYLYWNLNITGADITTLYEVSNPSLSRSGFDVTPGTGTQTVGFQKFNYRSAFKVGLGFNTPFDDWTVAAEYTWYHHTFDTKIPAVNGGFYSYQYDDLTFGRLYSYQGDSKWRFNLDIGDIMLQRAFYQGKRLTLTPSFGLRGQWIKQNLDFSFLFSSDFPVLPRSIVNTRTDRLRSDSWAVGPRIALDMNWLLGAGFRILGMGGFSTLYTKYTHVDAHVTDTMGDDFTSNYATPFKTLRVDTEMNIGLGWGSYVAGKDCYLSFKATYDFNVFFLQNMMRYQSDQFQSDVGAAPANIFLHGLNIRAQFNF